MSRPWQLGVVALALVAGPVVVVFVHRSHGDSDAQRGALTPAQYAVALRWAQLEVTKDDADLS